MYYKERGEKREEKKQKYKVKWFDNRKKRKRRGIKKAGYESYDLCPGCYYRNCDPIPLDTRADKKIRKRLKEGKCPACGFKECKCKSK